MGTETSGTRTVVVADDHAVARDGTIGVLRRLEGVEVVAEVGDGLQAIAAIKRLRPDLLVVDAAMPLAKGIEVYADCRRWSPDTAVVLLTGFTSAGILSDWLQADVDAILLKSCSPEEMVLCFETVLAGGHYVAEAAREILETSVLSDALTNREREVLSLIASGHRNAAIAERLHISEKTVEKHRGSLMQKLGVHSVAELMVYALKEGLLDEHTQL